MSYLLAGWEAIRRRPGLVLLFYAAHLLPALVLTVPIYAALEAVVGPTGFGPELAAGFDVVLWADVMEKADVALGGIWSQLFWMVPLYLLWTVAAHVGLVHALRGGGGRSFWQGVGDFTGRGVLLALLFGVLIFFWAVVVGCCAVILSLVWQSEVGIFWNAVVLTPAFAVLGLLVLDLMHDYARIALVAGYQRPTAAWRTGMRWPFRHRAALGVYATWLAAAAFLLLVPLWLDHVFAATTAGTAWALFLLQQVAFVLRAAATVGWVGSEVALYEDVQLREAPLIAEAPEAAYAAGADPAFDAGSGYPTTA